MNSWSLSYLCKPAMFQLHIFKCSETKFCLATVVALVSIRLSPLCRLLKTGPWPGPYPPVSTGSLLS